MISFFFNSNQAENVFFLLFVCFQQFKMLDNDGSLAFATGIDAQARDGSNPLRMRRKREDVEMGPSGRDERKREAGVGMP